MIKVLSTKEVASGVSYNAIFQGKEVSFIHNHDGMLEDVFVGNVQASCEIAADLCQAFLF